MRAKNVISQLPPGIGDDLEYDSQCEESDNGSDGEEEDSTILGSLPSWVYSSQFQSGDINKEIIAKYI